jgi:hypothetical protein
MCLKRLWHEMNILLKVYNNGYFFLYMSTLENIDQAQIMKILRRVSVNIVKVLSNFKEANKS